MENGIMSRFSVGAPAPNGSGPATTAPELSVVIPCYNEEEVLPELHRRLAEVCVELGWPYELVLVNDGSRDRTWPILAGLAADDPHLVAVNLSRNHGHQLALLAGLSLCRGERILILDADLQDPPELLPELLRVMDQERADVVYGQRRSRAGETALKLATAALFYRLIERLADVPIPRDTGDFRLMTRRALDVLLAMPERHRFTRGMVSWIGFRQVPILYDRQPRLLGTTKYPFRKMFRFALDAITAFSVKPLVLASLGGVLTSLLALALGAYSIVAYIRGSTVVGWTSLMTVITFLSSIQLLVLGVIGEYLGRMYEQVKGRPLFIIDQVVRSDRGTDPDNPLSQPEFRAGTPQAPRGGTDRAATPTPAQTRLMECANDLGSIPLSRSCSDAPST
jgi:glycosyltransferase involved in cell wall biosynthesis